MERSLSIDRSTANAILDRGAVATWTLYKRDHGQNCAVGQTAVTPQRQISMPPQNNLRGHKDTSEWQDGNFPVSAICRANDVMRNARTMLPKSQIIALHQVLGLAPVQVALRFPLSAKMQSASGMTLASGGNSKVFTFCLGWSNPPIKKTHTRHGVHIQETKYACARAGYIISSSLVSSCAKDLLEGWFCNTK